MKRLIFVLALFAAIVAVNAQDITVSGFSSTPVVIINDTINDTGVADSSILLNSVWEITALSVFASIVRI